MKSPLKSIREKCLDCCQSANEVRLCPCDGKQSTWCSLWPYRFGRGYKKRFMSDEQKKKVVERFKKAREAKKAQVEVSSII